MDNITRQMKIEDNNDSQVVLPPSPSPKISRPSSPHSFFSPMKAQAFPSSIIMRRRRTPTLHSPPPTTPPPSSPPSLPPKTQNPNGSKPKNPNGSKPKPETRRSLTPYLNTWHPLPIPISELSLPLTLPTGQTFRWRRTSAADFTGVIGPHLLSLRHVDRHVEFLHHNPNPNPGCSLSSVKSAVGDYFNLAVDLGEMWRGFADVDERFAELAGSFGGGARVLRQDPVECLFQFLCSSNNNIGRIEKMVGVISSYGRRLGSVEGIEFFEFPTIERLAVVTEAELREAGFGYRYDLFFWV